MLGFETEPRCGWRDRGYRGAPPPAPDHIELLVARVERHLGISAAQREAWERLTETVRDSVEALEIARAGLDCSEENALTRFDRLGDIACVVSAAVRRVRPALEDLYRTLDARQRKALDELIAGARTRAAQQPWP